MVADVPPRLLEPFLAAAANVSLSLPEVDPELARELMTEAATVLHNGLVLVLGL